MAGEVELYAVIDIDGRQIGNRYLLRHANKGDILYAAPVTKGDATCRLIAVAVQPAVFECVDDLHPEHLDDWISALSDSIARAYGRYQGGRVLPPGDAATLSAQEEIRGGRDVTWAEITDGSVSLLARSDTCFAAGSVLPLTTAMWVTAGVDGARLSGGMVDRCHGSSGWQEALDRWQTAGLSVLTDSLCAIEDTEADRARQAAAWSGQARAATEASVAQALSGRADAYRVTDEDRLAAVCRLVADAIGLDLPAQLPRAVPSSLGRLERIVRYTRAPVRLITLQGRWWRSQFGPMIAFRRDGGEPVAVIPGSRGRYELRGPGLPAALPLTPERAAELEANAYVLYPVLPDHPLRVGDLLRFGLTGARRDLGLMLLMGLAGSLLGLVIPAAISVLVDEFIPSRLETPLLELGALLLLVVAVLVIVNVTQDLTQIRIMGRSAYRLQPAIMDRTIRLPSDVLKRFTSADLAERVRIIDSVRDGLDTLVIDSMVTGIFSLSSIGLMLVMSPPLAAVGVGLTIPLLCIASWASYAQLPALAAAEARMTDASHFIFQLVDKVSHLRSSAAEERAFARWGALYNELQMSLLRASAFATRLSGFSAVYGIAGLAVFFVALQRFAPPDMTIGQMIMLVSVFGGFATTSTAFASALQKVFLLQPKIARARALLATEPEADAVRLDPGELSGRIEVSHLTFGYQEGAEPTLQDLSLVIDPGEFIALVGPSGSGKTTLLKLLLGFEHGRTGSILYDEHDLKRLDIRVVRRQIGTVLQSDRLMPGTLLENILGVSGRSNEEAWEVARQAGIAEEIEAMPMGMHTLLTDGGSTLSGGQIQRLLIARALIGQPRIIFFDEATSALDNRSQAIVMHSLERMAITRVVVAHRLSTIRNADRIIVMEAGRIVQSGRYEELAAQPGLFAALISRQES